MKYVIAALFCLLTVPAFAQNGAPTAQQVRDEIAGEIKSFNIPPVPVAKVVNITIWTGQDSLKIRIYYGSDKTGLPVIYNIHGGALVACDLDTHDNICRILASRTHSMVVAVDYRKPSEFPYPAGIDDCYFLLGWLKSHAAALGGDPAKLIIAGDSGGGLFASGIIVKLIQDKQPIQVKGLVLINPAEDLRTPGGGLYGLVVNWYLKGRSADDPVISPLTAKDVSGFPPSLVVICGQDELKAQDEQMVQKLKSAGVATSVITIANEGHLGGLWAAGHPKAQQAIDAAVSFIAGIVK